VKTGAKARLSNIVTFVDNECFLMQEVQTEKVSNSS